ncbi:hypothetical protein JB92DRAFT_3096983 [Gautieria morchelliformis]|nr:hypothetical protein JB92DRAFT_3096983 [Gautieria morchelliformis]
MANIWPLKDYPVLPSRYHFPFHAPRTCTSYSRRGMHLADKYTKPLAFEVIFPFVNQMIIEIGVVTDPERVGFYSALIESIFSCMSFIAIMPASYLADRVGRKPVILGGIAGLAVSTASFGMSKSFLAMVLSRCIGCALGGAWACSKIMTRFWREYLFALPCFVASIIAICSVIMGYLTLHETRPSKKSLMRISTYGTMSAPTDLESITAWDASTPTEHTDESIERPSIKSILTPSIISLLVNSLTMCLASETLFSLFPLFAFTPIASGGLGMSEAAIGTHMAMRAVIHIGIGTIYAPLERYFGSALRFYRIIMCAWPLTILCAPMLNSMARRGEEGTWSFNCALLVFYFIWAGSGLAWTSTAIMVTEAAPSPGALATLYVYLVCIILRINTALGIVTDDHCATRGNSPCICDITLCIFYSDWDSWRESGMDCTLPSHLHSSLPQHDASRTKVRLEEQKLALIDH